MASSGIFELVALAAGAVQSDDVLAIVDVHDSTQAAQGSTKRITLANLYTAATTAVTVSTPLPNITQTWNAGGVTFTAVKLNVTDTASAAGSLLLDLQVGGASKFSVGKSGAVVIQFPSTGQALLTFSNTTAGSAANALIAARNDVSDQTGINVFSSTYTTSGSAIARGGRIFCDGSGGLTVVAGGGTLGLYAGGFAAGNLGLTVGTDQSVKTSGAFGCNGNTPQTKQVSGGTLGGVIAALVANGILSS